MSQRLGASLGHRIQVELVEADIEIGFRLVDLAEEESALGDSDAAARVLREAEGVFSEIKQRLLELGTKGSEPFVPLVAELRRSLDRLDSHH